MKKIFKNLIAFIFWLAVWYVIAAVVNKPLLLPYPHGVIVRLITLLGDKVFWLSAFYSIIRMTIGIAAGIAIGAVLAYLTSKLGFADAIISPLMSVVRATPVASFIVLFLLWIGRSILPGVISAMVVIPIVWSNVLSGIRSVDKNLEEMAVMYRLSWTKRMRYISLPQIRPYFMAAVKTAVGMGWKSGVAAEVLAVPTLSIGKNIFESKLYLETTDLFAWTVFVVIISVVAEKLVLHFLIKKDNNRKEKAN